jgi:WD40 repeat protein
VILWDVQSRSVVNVYRGLRDAIAFLAFSPDDRFLAAASSAPSNALTVWSTTDFSVIHNRITENATQLLAWCAGSAALFVTTSGTSQIVLNTLEYNA